MGSSLELKRLLGPVVNNRLKSHYRKKDWEIIATSLTHIVLRIEAENIEFSRKTGNVTKRHQLRGGSSFS